MCKIVLNASNRLTKEKCNYEIAGLFTTGLIRPAWLLSTLQLSSFDIHGCNILALLHILLCLVFRQPIVNIFLYQQNGMNLLCC